MKNPFISESKNEVWIVAAVAGAVVAGALVWLYIKKSQVSAADEPKNEEHAMDYLKPKPGKHKRTTDLHGLHTLHDLAVSS